MAFQVIDIVKVEEKKGVLTIELPKELTTCVECGGIFVPYKDSHRFCCTKCRNRYSQREWRRKHKEQKLA